MPAARPASQITAELRVALRYRFPEPEWLLFEEISLDGYGRLDGLAINTYQSSGNERHGFELKATRRDWLGEIASMRKSETGYRFTDRWWLVTVPGVVQPGELPDGWGHLEMRGDTGRLYRVRAAPKRERHPVLRESLMIYMLRRGLRVGDASTQLAEQQRIRRDAFAEGHRAGAASVHHDYDRELAEAARRFQTETGLSLSSRSLGDLVTHLKYLQSGGDRELRRMARYELEQLERWRSVLAAVAAPPDPSRPS